MEEKSQIICNCRWKNCKRRGKCEECRAHHALHPKHPYPYCERPKAVRKKNAKTAEDEK